MSLPWRTAWITGASSGIGRELALALAEHGVKVAASARSADALTALARLKPGIAATPLDVTDSPAVIETARSITASLGPIDLAIFNAGVWAAVTARNFSAAKSAHCMAINYQGVVNGIEAVLPGMIERRQGHLALVASVAGYRGLPPTAAYGPTKAAVINLAEALRNDLVRYGITITVICPGYVATAMTAQNKFPMPFMIPAADAAQRIIRGLARRKFEIAFPWPLVAMMKLGRLLPYRLFFWYARTWLAPPRKT